jgi:transposase-like protein
MGNLAVVMDGTGLGNLGGLHLTRARQQNLTWHYTSQESVQDYLQAMNTLYNMNHHVSAVTIDGKPGVIQAFQQHYPAIHIQYCQFHQIKTIKQYIPMKAQSEAARSLRSLALRLTRCDEVQFTTVLRCWRVVYDDFFTEKSFGYHPNFKRKWWYTHRRLRSAYRSLTKNLPYLFTYQKYPHLNIPNTTNTCESFFSHFKERLGRHRGLSQSRKRKMADYLLENWN